MLNYLMKLSIKSNLFINNIIMNSIEDKESFVFSINKIHEKETISYLIKNKIVSIVLNSNFNSSDLVKFFSFIELSVFLKLKSYWENNKGEYIQNEYPDLHVINISNYTRLFKELKDLENPKNLLFWENNKNEINSKSNNSKFNESLKILFERYTVEIVHSSYNRIFKKNSLKSLIIQGINFFNHNANKNNLKDCKTNHYSILNFKRYNNNNQFDLDDNSIFSDNFKKSEVMTHYETIDKALFKIYSPYKLINKYGNNLNKIISTNYESKFNENSLFSNLKDELKKDFNSLNENLDLELNENKILESTNINQIKEFANNDSNKILNKILNNQYIENNINLKSTFEIKTNLSFDDNNGNLFDNNNIDKFYLPENINNSSDSFPNFLNQNENYFNYFEDYLTIKYSLIEDNLKN